MSASRAKAPKLFVLDTNVILHDAGCIRNFEENDVAIPIAVLEELDKFKKGNEDIHFQAREFLRRIDTGHHPVEVIAARHLMEALPVERVEVDV